MPKQAQTAEITNFVGGLITEASPLSFPTNASKDEDNFVLNRNGTRDRRLGMDYEDNFLLVSTGFSTTNLATFGINTFRWDSVSEETTTDFLVVQFGPQIHIYNILEANITQDPVKPRARSCAHRGDAEPRGLDILDRLARHYAAAQRRGDRRQSRRDLCRYFSRVTGARCRAGAVGL